MRRGLLPPAVVLVLTCAASGLACGPAPPDSGLVLGIAVSPTPAIVGPSRVLVTLADTDAPVSGATVILSGRPPGGRDLIVDTAREQGPGSYAAAAYPFTAPGEWVLTARASLPDGRAAEAGHAILVVERFPLR